MPMPREIPTTPGTWEPNATPVNPIPARGDLDSRVPVSWRPPPGTPVKSPSLPPPEPDLPVDQRNAYELVLGEMRKYGLEGLASKILDFVKKGLDPATVSLLIQDTAEWKQRFSGNEQRRRRGLPVLSPDQYLATETAMRDVLKNYGLPRSFYDQYEDFAGLIGNDVSADEMASRARYAWEFTQSSQAQDYKDLLREYYGVGDSYAVAYWLDPNLGQQVIERAGHALQYGRLAERQGLDVGRSTAERWFDEQISREQVDSGVAQAAGLLNSGVEGMASRFGQQYGQTEALAEGVEGDAAARATRERVFASERNLFGGSGGSQTAFGSDSGTY